jgi:predicted Fe-S protein YdhL (DUF1289 family)
MRCPHCQSERIKKNGHTHYDKQNYLCHGCGRQFVEGGQEWFVSDADKVLINRLLLERISLAGICRACQVSETWLLSYISDLYEALPEDLNADLTLGDVPAYLATRMDEEIHRIEVLKKIQRHYKPMFK